MGHFLDALTNTGLGALQWAGETADKPGRAIRGMLGGQGLGAAKNLVPFSDTFGLTDPAKSVSGRQLLNSVLGERDPNAGFGWGDAAGIGAEIALNPLSLGIGPASRALGAGAKAPNVGSQAGREAAAARLRPMAPSMSNQAYQARLPTRQSLASPSVSLPASAATSEVSNLGLPRSQSLSNTINAFGDIQPLNQDQMSKILAMESRGKGISPSWELIESQPGSSGPAGWLGKKLQFDPSSKGTPNQALEDFINRASAESDWQRFGSDIGGQYDAGSNVAGVFKGADDHRKALMHELGHGTVAQAVKLNRINELPYLEQIPARLQRRYQKSTPGNFWGDLAGGGAQITDELAQHTREGQSALGQTGNFLKYMFGDPADIVRNPRATVTDMFTGGSTSPTIRNKYINEVFSPFNKTAADIFKATGHFPGQAVTAFGAGAGGGLLLNEILGRE